MKATPRRLIRWKSFWLGILVLGFLGWAWVRSMSIQSICSFGRWRVSQHGGMVAADVNDVTIRTSSFHEDPYDLDPEWPTPAFVYGRAAEFGENWFGISHWFLILLFLIPWSAFLAWRWNKQRKLSPCAFS